MLEIYKTMNVRIEKITFHTTYELEATKFNDTKMGIRVTFLYFEILTTS